MPGLGPPVRIGRQGVEATRQFVVEHLPVGGQVVEIAVQVVGHPDGVEPHAEHLGVFGLLERELREIHLVAQSSLGPHRGHERLDVLGDRLLAGDELRAQPGGIVAFDIRQLLPVRPVAGEVNIGGIPELCVSPANSFNGRLSQLRPPRASEPERVRVM